MQLGIVADEISRDFREAVRVGKSLGIARYEVRFLKTGRAPLCDPGEIAEVERIADGEGVKVTALSPGLFKWTDDAQAFGEEMRELFPLAAEWANRWRLPGLIVFGFHKPDATEELFYRSEQIPAHVHDWFAEAGAEAQKAGLKLMIEPEPVCWLDTGRVAVELIAKIASDALRLNYDPGNVAWLLGKDPLEELETVAPFISNLHIKDLRALKSRGQVNEKAGPQWTVPGHGIIDYRAHFRLLKRLGYDGPVSLEPHMDGTRETTEECLRAVEALLKETESAL